MGFTDDFSDCMNGKTLPPELANALPSPKAALAFAAQLVKGATVEEALIAVGVGAEAAAAVAAVVVAVAVGVIIGAVVGGALVAALAECGTWVHSGLDGQLGYGRVAGRTRRRRVQSIGCSSSVAGRFGKRGHK